MPFHKGLNNHKAMKISDKDIVDFGRKKAISQVKSRQFIKNNYKYVLFQGSYYLGKVFLSHSKACPLIMLDKNVNLLQISKVELDFIKTDCYDYTTYNRPFNGFKTLGVSKKNEPLLNEFYLSTNCTLLGKEYSWITYYNELEACWYNLKSL